ncbi:hypothetical protein [Actinoplanes sp. CA-252034]|uniref:hypothetical protein n=1 Tax=Actinoplanes sp. CA-252034 TaxID=3239906 RepID=UPI003D99A98F
MRFFSNEAQDNVDDKTDRPTDRDTTDPDTTAPVPQQRAGSPWQHDTDPAPQPTAVGTSTVGDDPAATRPDDDPDRTDRLPDAADAADRTVAFSDGVTRDRDDAPAPKHTLPDDTTPKHKLPADADDGKDTDGDVKDGDRTGAEVREDDATVDSALEDRGTFDDPHLTEDHKDVTDLTKDDIDPAPEIGADPTPVVTPAAGTTAEPGALPFFPTADTQPLRDRWRDVQLRFVDDPKGATGDAAGLVDEAVDKLSQALRDHRGSFAKGTDDTEALRVELRSYRDILDRLLGL